MLVNDVHGVGRQTVSKAAAIASHSPHFASSLLLCDTLISVVNARVNVVQPVRDLAVKVLFMRHLDQLFAPHEACLAAGGSTVAPV